MADQLTTSAAPWSGSVVRIVGEIDCSTAPAMRAAFDEAWRDGNVDLLVDLSGATFMDCAGLTVLLHARQDWQGRLTLYQPPRSLRRILQALGMDDAFTISDAVGTTPS